MSQKQFRLALLICIVIFGGVLVWNTVSSNPGMMTERPSSSDPMDSASASCYMNQVTDLTAEHGKEKSDMVMTYIGHAVAGGFDPGAYIDGILQEAEEDGDAETLEDLRLASESWKSMSAKCEALQ